MDLQLLTGKPSRGPWWEAGLLIQLILAVGILYVPFIQVFFEVIGKGFVKILAFTNEGVTYLFKRNDTGEVDPALQNFAFSILPTIIFFSALSSLLFYLGVIQLFVKGFGYALSRALGLSGAESLSVAGNIFLGQTESPLLIKPYLEKMSQSEILLVMSGGMATLAGGVLAAYIGFLGGGDPVQQVIFAKHLLTASVMAAPGVVVISKIIVPETESHHKKIEVVKEGGGKKCPGCHFQWNQRRIETRGQCGCHAAGFYRFYCIYQLYFY